MDCCPTVMIGFSLPPSEVGCCKAVDGGRDLTDFVADDGGADGFTAAAVDNDIYLLMNLIVVDLMLKLLNYLNLL
mgnify:CR=1 FL=1